DYRVTGVQTCALPIYPFGVHDSDHALCGRAQVGNTFLRVNVHARHEDAVDALEVTKPRLATPRPTPDRITGELVLAFGKHQRHKIGRASCRESEKTAE